MLTRALPSALASARELYIRQVRELAELLGFESRNKYAILSAQKEELGFAAEQQKGLVGLLLRNVLGHWRRFDITFFGPDRQPIFRATHPFRLFFQRLEVYTPEGTYVGALQQRFSVFRKSFDVLGANGEVLFQVRSGFFQFWTFPFLRDGQEAAVVEKRWSGALRELFTDSDNFRVRFVQPERSVAERLLVLASAIFIDLQYFERKA